MKHHIVRTIALAVLSLGLAATASRTIITPARSHAWQEPGDTACKERSFPESGGGTLTVLVAFVGTYTVEANGDLSGTQTSNANGTVSLDVLKGTLTVNPDCTGTQTVEIYNQSGNLVRSAVWALVFMDDARESRGTFRELKLPNGTVVPAIAIAEGKKATRL